MLLPTLFMLCSLSQEPVTLGHIFKVGERDSYNVTASIHIEERAGDLETFLPSDTTVTYNFATKILGVEAGNATMRYSRPSITQLDDTIDSDHPKKSVDKLNQLVQLTISPANEVLEEKDLNPPKSGSQDSNDQRSEYGFGAFHGRQIESFIDPFVSDMIRLSAFIGPFDASLDFAPPLPLTPVKVGDQWKRTVSYQPQKLKSKSGKTVVQRLDITYTYKGDTQVGNTKFASVTADLTLDTDLGNYLNDLFDTNSDETHIKSIPLKLTEHIQFFLDPTTYQTKKAVVDSSGGFTILTTESNEAVEEVRLKANNVMQLTSVQN